MDFFRLLMLLFIIIILFPSVFFANRWMLLDMLKFYLNIYLFHHILFNHLIMYLCVWWLKTKWPMYSKLEFLFLLFRRWIFFSASSSTFKWPHTSYFRPLSCPVLETNEIEENVLAHTIMSWSRCLCVFLSSKQILKELI